MAATINHYAIFFVIFSSIALLDYSAGFHPGKFPIVPRQQQWQQSFLFRNPIYQKQVDAVDFEDLQARFGAITMIRKTGSSGGERKTGSSGGFGSQVASRGKKQKKSKSHSSPNEHVAAKTNHYQQWNKEGNASHFSPRLDVGSVVSDVLDPFSVSTPDEDTLQSGQTKEIFVSISNYTASEANIPNVQTTGRMPLAGFKVPKMSVFSSETSHTTSNTPGGWVDVLGWLLLGGPLWVYELRPLYVEVSLTEEVLTLGFLLLLPKILSIAIRGQPASANNSTDTGQDVTVAERNESTTGAGGAAGASSPEDRAAKSST